MASTASQATSAKPSVCLLMVRPTRSLVIVAAIYPSPVTPGVHLIEIVDYGRETNMNPAHKIQSFHRFLVDNLTSEWNAYPQNPWLLRPATTLTTDPAPAPITQLLGIDAKNVIICTHCHAVREKEQMVHVVDLVYPRKVSTACPIWLEVPC